MKIAARLVATAMARPWPRHHVMEWVCTQTHAACKSVTVAVDKNNRTQMLYRRLGFREIADHGVHWDIEWGAAADQRTTVI
jgi:hypothetical protein